MPQEKKPIDSTIVAAIIGGIVTIAVTAITVFANRPSHSATPVPQPVIITAVVTATTQPTAIPINTVFVGEPTSTLVPATATLEPTATFTAVPALEAGKDWLQNCISTVWKAYPASLTVSDKDGCYVNFVNGFTARDQRLQVYISEPSSSEGLIGMFVEIPSDGVVDLNFHLNNIDASELRMGIFQSADVKSQGIMVVVPAGNAKDSAFAVHSMPADKREYITGKFKKDSADYLVTFDIASGNVIVRFEKYTSVKPLSVPADANGKKWLFIGYKTLVGKTNVIDANFFDLVITPR